MANTNATTREPRAYSINLFCKTFSISRSKVYELMEAGDLATVKMGAKRLIPIESANEWFAKLPTLEEQRRLDYDEKAKSQHHPK